MKQRAPLLRAVLASTALSVGVGSVGCWSDDYEGFGPYDDSSILFGIDQSKAADGKVTTSVGYEMLDVRSHGWSTRGYVTAERSCWAERLDDRLGQPRVAGGVATFKGGLLPASGVAVIANRADDLKLDGPAWTKPGESLTFEAKGFAMPEIEPSRLVLPSTDLAIVTPADAAAEVAIARDQELAIAWTPSDKSALRESVVVSLTAVPESQPTARGVELRCFFERSAGTGRFPKTMLDRFATLLGASASAGGAGGAGGAVKG
ncbi:unnamed protein product, partial [marine sediment metagenome]